MVHDQNAIKDQVATEYRNYPDLIDQDITGLMEQSWKICMRWGFSGNCPTISGIWWISNIISHWYQSLVSINHLAILVSTSFRFSLVNGTPWHHGSECPRQKDRTFAGDLAGSRQTRRVGSEWNPRERTDPCWEPRVLSVRITNKNIYHRVGSLTLNELPKWVSEPDFWNESLWK